MGYLSKICIYFKSREHLEEKYYTKIAIFISINKFKNAVSPLKSHCADEESNKSKEDRGKNFVG